MDDQVPLTLGSIETGTMTLKIVADGTISSTSSFSVFDQARLIVSTPTIPQVGDAPVTMALRLVDSNNVVLKGFNSVATLTLPNGAGTFGSDIIRIRDGISEPFTYIPGTTAGNFSLSASIPGIVSI